MWKINAELGRLKMTTSSMWIACWIPKVTDINSK
jgi:hypothetical protein